MNTKVYGTIGPSCCDEATLAALFEAGMTGIRVNLSHSDLKDVDDWLCNIKRASKGKADILIDLRGPELRIGRIANEKNLEEGKFIKISSSSQGDECNCDDIPVSRMVFDKLSCGQEIMLDDGKILVIVESMAECNAICRVVRGGILRSGKSIALPGVEIYPPTLTESDMMNIASIKKYGVTGVMLPFVRDKRDLMNLKQALIENNADDVKIFAKIENIKGAEGLHEFINYCDEVVIARGDLGNAVPLWELPVMQDKIAKLCRESEKKFMVVTQMLSSMENSKVPTRAEVSDIFNAVKLGAASVMLTGETAAGKYPLEAMKFMVNTVTAAEEYLGKNE